MLLNYVVDVDHTQGAVLPRIYQRKVALKQLSFQSRTIGPFRIDVRPSRTLGEEWMRRE